MQYYHTLLWPRLCYMNNPIDFYILYTNLPDEVAHMWSCNPRSLRMDGRWNLARWPPDPGRHIMLGFKFFWHHVCLASHIPFRSFMFVSNTSIEIVKWLHKMVSLFRYFSSPDYPLLFVLQSLLFENFRLSSPIILFMLTMTKIRSKHYDVQCKHYPGLYIMKLNLIKYYLVLEYCQSLHSVMIKNPA